MSATHDKSHRITFIYSNLYKVYKSGETHALIQNDVSLEKSLSELESLNQRLSKFLKGLKNKLK